MNRCCRALEPRRYTFSGGQCGTLIELFNREFVEPQECLRSHVLGQFRYLDDPDRSVWWWVSDLMEIGWCIAAPPELLPVLMRKLDGLRLAPSRLFTLH